jgi:hypothetical protein
MSLDRLEHLENKLKEQRLNESGVDTMLAIAISALFIVTGLVAASTIADNLLKARSAYLRLLREGEVMRAGLALQAAVGEMRLRPQARAVTPIRRTMSSRARSLQLPVCAAA